MQNDCYPACRREGEGKDWERLSVQPFKFSTQGSKAFYFACDPSTCHNNFPSCSSSFNCFHISIIISFLLHLKLSLTAFSPNVNGIHLSLSSHWGLRNEKWRRLKTRSQNRDTSALVYRTSYKTRGTQKWINVSSQTKISISFFPISIMRNGLSEDSGKFHLKTIYSLWTCTMRFSLSVLTWRYRLN